MPNPRILALLFLLPALCVRAAPPAQAPQDLPQPAPVRPCLIDTSRCLSLAPQPFRPCLAGTRSCGNRFSITPVTNPAWTPVSAAPQRAKP